MDLHTVQCVTNAIEKEREKYKMSKSFIIKQKGFLIEARVFHNVIEWDWSEEGEFYVFNIYTTKFKRKIFIKKESVEYFGNREDIHND